MPGCVREKKSAVRKLQFQSNFNSSFDSWRNRYLPVLVFVKLPRFKVIPEMENSNQVSELMFLFHFMGSSPVCWWSRFKILPVTEANSSRDQSSRLGTPLCRTRIARNFFSRRKEWTRVLGNFCPTSDKTAVVRKRSCLRPRRTYPPYE